jgi:hypothetical protein
VSRDYLTVKIWDVNMERQPVKTIPIHEHLRPRLCDTYENDSIFDKFEVVFSGDADNVMTGSYNNNFMIYPTEEQKDTEIVLQADKSAFKAKKVGVPTPMNKGNGKKAGSRSGSPAGPGSRMKKETDADQIDFNKKILHMSWHPFEDSIAIAATNNVSSSTSHPVNLALTPAALCFLRSLIEMPSSFFMDRRIWGLDRVADGLEQADTKNENQKIMIAACHGSMISGRSPPIPSVSYEYEEILVSISALLSLATSYRGSEAVEGVVSGLLMIENVMPGKGVFIVLLIRRCVIPVYLLESWVLLYLVT